MKNRISGLVILCVLLATTVYAIKTSLIDIGREGEYDGRVRISRDEGGNMVFKDDAHTTPVTLAELSQGVKEHGELLGLGNDDHGQYLTSSRHGAQHTTAFNDALPISPDIRNHTMLGQHLQDSDIHVSRSQGETITGAWKFDGQPEFRDNIKMSRQGAAGNGDILFEDGGEDARIRWDDGYNRFEFNRKIKAAEAEMESLTVSSSGRFIGALSGKEPQGVPMGRIENFASIEGIGAQNLVDKTADEDISGQWDFLNDVYVDGDLTTSGILNPLGGIKGLGKGNVVTVAKKGGDFSSIQAAINAATSGDVIMIFPGIYSEKLIISKSDIQLVGCVPNGAGFSENNNPETIITYASSGVGNDLMTVWIKSGGATALTKIVLANLTIINTAALGTGDAEEALDIGRGDTYGSANHEVYIKNCSLYGEQDTVFVNCAGKAVFDGCHVDGHSDICSIADYVIFKNTSFYTHSGDSTHCSLWVGRSGGVAFIAKFINCSFDCNVVSTTGGVGRYGENGTILYFMNCSVFPNAGTHSWNANGKTGTIYLSNTNGGNWGTVTVMKEKGLDIEGSANIPTINSQIITIYHPGPDTYLKLSSPDGIQFSDVGTGYDYDVNLYRDGANILKTDDAFDANSIKTNGTTRISSDGVGTFESLDSGPITGTIGLFTGNMTIGDDSSDHLVVSDYCPQFPNLGNAAGDSEVRFDSASKFISFYPMACPSVFYRIDGEDWQYAGEIIKDANGNIFEGIVELGEVKESIIVQIINFKDEIDFIDYAAFVRIVESAPDAPPAERAGVKHEEFPVKDRLTCKRDQIFRKLNKGEKLEYKGELRGKFGFKIVGYYTDLIRNRDKDKEFLDKRENLLRK